MKHPLTQLVIDRARDCCEYCLLPASATLLPFHVDHVYAKQHGGSSEEKNLAYACPSCNSHKGTNLTSLDPDRVSDEPVQLFHPRDTWTEHFRLEGPLIRALTIKGRATAFLLQFNDEYNREQRIALIEEGLYPPPHYQT